MTFQTKEDSQISFDSMGFKINFQNLFTYQYERLLVRRLSNRKKETGDKKSQRYLLYENLRIQNPFPGIKILVLKRILKAKYLETQDSLKIPVLGDVTNSGIIGFPKKAQP